jgi:hypothetical protein
MSKWPLHFSLTNNSNTTPKIVTLFLNDVLIYNKVLECKSTIKIRIKNIKNPRTGEMFKRNEISGIIIKIDSDLNKSESNDSGTVYLDIGNIRISTIVLSTDLSGFSVIDNNVGYYFKEDGYYSLDF